MSIIFECKDLTKKYGDFTAVENLIFLLKEEDNWPLGPNGSGKTTLIKMSNRFTYTSTKGK